MNELASSVARALTRGEQLLALLDRKASVQDSINAVPVKQTKGFLAMHKVSFSYPAASDQPSRQKVLHEIDLELNPGTLTVLVGPSGEGKSTLLNLMLRLFEPDSGQLLLDGVHYQDLQLRSLRNQFAIMLQTTHLYAGTLREALQPVESSTSDTKLWETLEQVAMNDFAHALPAKLDAPLGEDGINLSGGQRARLSLARALLLDRPILLLDEPLANVDLHSQTVILSALEKIRRGKTCLAVTHQPIMTERADVVVQLKNQALTTLSHRPAQMLDARRAR